MSHDIIIDKMVAMFNDIMYMFEQQHDINKQIKQEIQVLAAIITATTTTTATRLTNDEIQFIIELLDTKIEDDTSQQHQNILDKLNKQSTSL